MNGSLYLRHFVQLGISLSLVFFLSCFLILITQTETNGQGTSSMQKFINTVNSLKLIIGKGTPRLIYVNKSLDVGFAFVAR